MKKIAEKAFTDSGEFPLESMRERLARRYGIDAVALSGPCEGKPLVDCIVNQLQRRWDRIKDRYASSGNKAIKLAIKLAESYMRKDDTENCIKDLQSLGYKEAAAKGIASFMKAEALASAAELDLKTAMGEIYAEEPTADAPPADDMGGDDMPMDDMGMESEEPAELPPPTDATVEPEMGEGDMGEMGGMDEGMDMGDMGGEETVTIELPVELAEQLSHALEGQMGDMGGMDLDNEMGEPGLEVVIDDGMGGMEEGLGIGGAPEPGGEAVPGEPMEGMDDHEVEGAEETAGMGQPGGAMQMAGDHPGTCKACGGVMASEGHHDEEMSTINRLQHELNQLKGGEEKEHKGEQSEKEHDKKEHHHLKNMDKEVGKWEKEEGMKDEKEASSLSSAEKAENKEFGEKVYASNGKAVKLAALNMRSGHLRSVGNRPEVKTAQEIARLGNPMKMNNTDQLIHLDEYGKELGNAKEKNPEAPKPLEDNNVKPEGYTANGTKFQDGSTMGHETKFDPHVVQESEWTAGDKSLMGKDESFPKDKPNVPAGSSPIGHEPWEGGNISTKGTVIASISATITPNGVIVESANEKFLAPGQIKSAMVAKVQEGLSKLPYDGDAKKFAAAAVAIIKEASEGDSKSYTTDGVTKCDTSKLEAERFTNDKDKKPVEGGAMTSKGKGEDQHKSKDIPKTDTSKLEADKFTNDAEKKAEPDDEHRGYAASEKEVKTAAETKTAKESPREKDGPKDYNKAVTSLGDKAVEEPKPLEDGNVKPEGFTAGDSKFQNNETMGHEPKFDPHVVEKKEYTGGDSSLQGKDESFPKDGPKVPAGKGQMGHEPWEGGDLSTKGTTIAENSSKRQVSAEEIQAKLNDAKLREERLKAASVYCAEMLANGDIRPDQYVTTFEKIAEMPVPAIQALIAQAKDLRTRIIATAESNKESKVGGMSVAYVHAANKNSESLKDRLVAEFKLTKTLNRIDEMNQD